MKSETYSIFQNVYFYHVFFFLFTTEILVFLDKFCNLLTSIQRFLSRKIKKYICPVPQVLFEVPKTRLGYIRYYIPQDKNRCTYLRILYIFKYNLWVFHWNIIELRNMIILGTNVNIYCNLFIFFRHKS